MLDIFKIGVGPSSSHTVGPMRAAAAFAHTLSEMAVLTHTIRVRVILYGSLSLTGLGHGTDRAVLAGLTGADPATVDTDWLAQIRDSTEQQGTITLDGSRTIAFDCINDLIFERWQRLAPHPNGMRFTAYDAAGTVLAEQVWYSVGGGTIEQGTPADPLIGIHDPIPANMRMAGQTDSEAGCMMHVPYPFATSTQLLKLCNSTGLSIADIVMANETASGDDEHTRQAIRARLLHVWETMKDCVQHGCTSTATELPGGLHVPRRAPSMYRAISAGADVLRRTERSSKALELSDAAWVNLFAFAVSEENAGGGRVVTSPTNGSAGIIPAVLHYYWHFVQGSTIDGVVEFLLTAAAIGHLFRTNASISGAEVGCQGEVGVACSMAAAGLCAVLGGTPQQVENAAEIGIEHHLGLTCDPVAGLVQIPCIERNAMAANTAINAVRITMLGDGSHMVGLDEAIRTMRETGADMLAKYKETSQGGLAVHVVKC